MIFQNYIFILIKRKNIFFLIKIKILFTYNIILLSSINYLVKNITVIIFTLPFHILNISKSIILQFESRLVS